MSRSTLLLALDTPTLASESCRRGLGVSAASALLSWRGRTIATNSCRGASGYTDRIVCGSGVRHPSQRETPNTCHVHYLRGSSQIILA